MDLKRKESSLEEPGMAARSSFDGRRNSERAMDVHHSSARAGASSGWPPANSCRVASTDLHGYAHGKLRTVAGRQRHHASRTLSPLLLDSQDGIGQTCRSLLSWLPLDNPYHEGKHPRGVSQDAEKQDRAPETSFPQSSRSLATGSAASLPRCCVNPSNLPGAGHYKWHGDVRVEDSLLPSLLRAPLLNSELVASPSRRGPEQPAGVEVADSDSDALSSELNGELELEAISALEVPCHSYLPGVADCNADRQLSIFGGKELSVCEPRPRNLSQKYRPKAFQDLVGQNVVLEALSNAIQKGKIAPAYLFQGSRGTGKTSAARIFAAALNCLSSDARKPCWICPECTALVSGNSLYVKEVDAASNNGIEKAKALLETTISDPAYCRYKVFIIDECHMLTTETWNALLKVLEEPPMDVVFVLITTDPDQLPRTAVSRCQKFPFLKIKDSEIVGRLKRLANLEQIEIVPEALDLIPTRSDGSLRDAETILDQLSLFGHKITLEAVHELVGCASNEKVARLLNSALLGDTVGTVQKARELIDSGVEPLSLITQLATLITDMLSDSNINKQCDGDLCDLGSLSHEKLERLQKALKILSEAEKQVRASHDRTTWFVAALVQLGPDNSFNFTSPLETANTIHHAPLKDDISGYENHSSRIDKVKYQHDYVSMYADSEDASNKASFYRVNRTSTEMKSAQSDRRLKPSQDIRYKSYPDHMLKLHKKEVAGNLDLLNQGNSLTDPEKYMEATQIATPTVIWMKMLEACPSIPLRHFLQYQGKLLSLSITEGEAIACLEFIHPEHKSKAERSRRSIAAAFQAVLGFPVEIRISLASLPIECENSRLKFNYQELSRQMQDCHIHNKNNNGADANGFHSDRSVLDNYSLHSLINQGRVYPHVSELIPAMTQGQDFTKDEHHFESAGSDRLSPSYWNSAPPSGSESEKNCGQYVKATVSEEQAGNTWSQKAGQYKPFIAADGGSRGSPIFKVPIQGHNEMVENSPQMLYEQYMSEHFGAYGKNVQSALILESENLPGIGSLQEYRHGSSTKRLGFESENSSPDPHGLETRSGKKVQRMAMKNRFKSFAKSEKKKFFTSPNSIYADASCQEVEIHNTAASQKKGRLLGAAESIARLFLNK